MNEEIIWMLVMMFSPLIVIVGFTSLLGIEPDDN